MFNSNSIDNIHELEADEKIQVWWSDGQPHRVDGPAMIYNDRIHEEWIQHGSYHRIGGPAVIGNTGKKIYWWWWVHGERMRTWKQYQKFSKCSDSDIIFLRLKWGDTGMVN